MLPSFDPPVNDRLICDFASGGAWAGVRDLVRGWVHVAEERFPELLAEHAEELAAVLPTLRPQLQEPGRDPLEDLGGTPRNRAPRWVHGLIDFVAACQERSEPAPWVVVCEGFGGAGDLVQLFFRELLRRRGASLRLTLVLIDDTGPVPSTVEWAARAQELEERVAGDPLRREERCAKLASLWSRSETPERAGPWQALAFRTCRRHGLHRAALSYGKLLLAHLDAFLSLDATLTRWEIAGGVAQELVTLGEPEGALALLEREALPGVEDPADRVRLFHDLAMLHARFLPRTDLGKAEEYVDRALAALEGAPLAASERAALQAFTLSGLAFIRFRQGRRQEAAEVCRAGIAALAEHPEKPRQRRQRAILLYNIGQVHTAMRCFEEAIPCYSAAIADNPYYSEFYNERGNLYLALGRGDEAVRDYEIALTLSPPYPEVWINLGQAHKLAGRLEDAVAAYTRALDLDPLGPGAMLPLLGRAQACERLGLCEEAVRDYSAALAIDPAQPLVLANRAALYYEMNRIEEALTDLDRAVLLAPDEPDLALNRSLALAALGRSEGAPASP